MSIESAVRPRPLVPRAGIVEHLRELIRFRELIYNLVVRDLKARYKNSIMGFLWSLLNPLAMMMVFTVVFTVLLPANSQMPKYPIFLLTGLLPWNYFSAGMMVGTNSIVMGSNLVKKVYFPREVLPIASVLANLVNFLLSLVVLFGVLIAFRGQFSPWMWMLPIVILIQTCFILGIVFILSTLNVFYRDIMMILDVAILAWFFLTPIFYSTASLPSSYRLLNITLDVHRWLYILNPMASLIQAYRDLLYSGHYTDLDFFARTAVTALGILAIGYWFLIHYSGRFGEEL